MSRRQLYLDPVLQSKINIKNIEKQDFKDFQDIVSFVWKKYLEKDFELKGYTNEKGKVMLTTDMKRTSVELPVELNKAVNDKLDEFGKKRIGKISFSMITNEILKRIYLEEEFDL